MIQGLFRRYLRAIRPTPEVDIVAPEGWSSMVGRDGHRIAIPADLADQAFTAELINAAEHFGKDLIGDGNPGWILDLQAIRNVIYIAMQYDDQDMALIDVGVKLLDWSFLEADDDEPEEDLSAN